MPIRIRLNGEPHDLPDRMSVLALLERLDVDPRTVAVELNRAVVRRPRYGETQIEDGAEVEIVAFVGGGRESGDTLS
jgi:sulfur carrier protein